MICQLLAPDATPEQTEDIVTIIHLAVRSPVIVSEGATKFTFFGHEEAEKKLNIDIRAYLVDRTYLFKLLHNRAFDALERGYWNIIMYGKENSPLDDV